MLALVQFGHSVREVEMPFRDFLFSGFLAGHAKTAMCEPKDLVRDHLPPFDPEDREETCEAVREACEQATDGETSAVRLDATDLRFVRRHLIADAPLILPFPHPLEAV